MKDKKKNVGTVGVSSSTATNATISNVHLHGVMKIERKKKRPEDLILHRLKEYLVYSKLRSLIPPRPFQPAGRAKDRYEEKSATSGAATCKKEQEQGEETENNSYNAVNTSKEDGIEDTEISNRFVPSIIITRMDGSILIKTVVLNHVSLTSTLFIILEEEKLDVVFENQYRTDSKVVHTIQVKVEPGYDIDALEKRLSTWAGKHM